MDEEKFLLFPAVGEIDEDDGLTLEEMLKMLAAQLGYVVTKKEK